MYIHFLFQSLVSSLGVFFSQHFWLSLLCLSPQRLTPSINQRMAVPAPRAPGRPTLPPWPLHPPPPRLAPPPPATAPVTMLPPKQVSHTITKQDCSCLSAQCCSTLFCCCLCCRLVALQQDWRETEVSPWAPGGVWETEWCVFFNCMCVCRLYICVCILQHIMTGLGR